MFFLSLVRSRRQAFVLVFAMSKTGKIVTLRDCIKMRGKVGKFMIL